MLQPSSKQKNKELKQDKSSFMYQIGKKKKKTNLLFKKHLLSYTDDTITAKDTLVISSKILKYFKPMAQ